MKRLATVINKEIILLGDVNANYLVQNDHKPFKEILQLFGIKQIIKKATRITKTSQSLIDITATNNPSLIRDLNVIPTAISDHDMVGCSRKVNHGKFKPKRATCRNFKSYNPEAMCDELNSVDWTPVYTADDVNLAWQYSKKYLTQIFDRN